MLLEEFLGVGIARDLHVTNLIDCPRVQVDRTHKGQVHAKTTMNTRAVVA
jgi:hypothetical protein